MGMAVAAIRLRGRLQPERAGQCVRRAVMRHDERTHLIHAGTLLVDDPGDRFRRIPLLAELREHPDAVVPHAFPSLIEILPPDEPCRLLRSGIPDQPQPSIPSRSIQPVRPERRILQINALHHLLRLTDG